ncbi:right-handed parallel beta-helix repeat-containing protein [Alienimonas californiensis]|nr:right-handed parallel beta-helix repeat-containing protein [Alienimonas californiensis]
MPRLVLPLAAAALLALSVPAGATNYYVRTSGNDNPADPSSGGKSASKAYRTMQRAANVAVAGDTVYVGAGTYSESVIGMSDGTSAAPLTWIADTSGVHTGDAGPVRVRPANGGSFAVRLMDENYIQFHGFAFNSNPNAAGADGVLIQNSHNLLFNGCTFHGFAAGVNASNGAFNVSNGTFSSCRSAVKAIAGSAVGMSDCNVVVPVDGSYSSGIDSRASALKVLRCTITGGTHGIYHVNGTGCSVTDSTVSGATSTGLWIEGGTKVVDGCEIVGGQYGLYLPKSAGSDPDVRNSVIRDGVVGIYAGWQYLILRDLTFSGHSDAAIRVETSIPAFVLGSEDTISVTNCRYGVAWNGNPSVAQSLTVLLQNWTDNVDHFYARDVETVIARDLTLSNAHAGLLVVDGAQVTVTGCTFADSVPTGSWRDEAAVYAQAATVTVTDCTIDRWSFGVHLIGATTLDLQRLTVRDSSHYAICLQDAVWNWEAADAIVLTDNWTGVYAKDCQVTIDGGAPGVTVDGAVGTGRGLYSIGGSAVWRNVHVTDSSVGFLSEHTRGALLDQCSATGCTTQALKVIRDPSDPAVVAATVTNFAATDCANGVIYNRGAGTADGVGQIELRDLSITRSVTLDGNGYAVGPTGAGLTLNDCPLVEALHTGLTVSGHETGLYVAGADLAVGAATALNVSACGSALMCAGGAVTISNWDVSGNWTALYALPAGRPVTVTDSALSARDYAVYIPDAGDLTVARCAVVTRDGAGFDVATTRTSAYAFVDCTVAAGGDGFLLDVGAGSGSITLERCTVTNAGDDGFSLLAPTVTATDCTVTAAVGDGFQCRGGAGLLTRCIVLDCGGAAAAATGTAALTADNLLGVGATGLYVDGAAASLLARYVTVASAAVAAHATNGGALTVVNGVLSSGSIAARADAGGSVILDYALLDAPTPYDGVAAGANDLLRPPLFEDAAAGDYRPAKGSPMINAGKNLSGVVDDDLRNFVRPSFNGYELGAYESEFPAGGVRILKWREVAQ